MQSYLESLHHELHRCPDSSLLNANCSETEVARDRLRRCLSQKVLGMRTRFAPRGIVVNETVFSTFRREKLLIECEPGSWQTALLYLPVSRKTESIPGVLLASGHGGSKSHGCNQIAAQIYAQMGCAVLVGDPLGEEERHEPYGLGLRGHRHEYVVDRMNEAEYPFLGKVVTDLLAGLDYLRLRPEVDASRVGCAGSSMGGTLVQLLVAVEPTFVAAVLSSWAADYRCMDGAIGCCYRLPGLIREAGQLELMALAAPKCALLVCAGDRDEVTPPFELEAMAKRLREWWSQQGAPERFQCKIETGGGHRPYHITPPALQWMAAHLGIKDTADFYREPTTTLGNIYQAAGKTLEPLYNQDRHHRGTSIPDWPLILESPESLRILDDTTLYAASLERRNFTLGGYLKLKGIKPLHPLPSLPRHASAEPNYAAERVRNALNLFTPKSTRSSASLSFTKPAHQHRWNHTLRFSETKLRVSRSRNCSSEGVLVLARGPSEPIELKGSVCATVDLVAFNDNETLLGRPSLLTNLELVRQACSILQKAYPDVRWELESWIPRLGELAFFFERSLTTLRIMSRHSVEPAAACLGRAENIVPNSAGSLYWIDLLLASAPRRIFLHRSYLSSEAATLLKQDHITYL